MTEKQEKILLVALKLFAERGYASTSTSKVAKEAGVSEGLIFRHFENKEGLLNAIIAQGHEMAKEMYASIMMLSEPKEIILAVIDMPFQVLEENYHYWRLMYALKWQADVYDATVSNPLKNVLVGAFQQLGYGDPVAEAELIMAMLDGVATAVLLRKPDGLGKIKKVLLEKYNL